MNKQLAIDRIHQIQNGKSNGFYDFPEEIKGKIAKRFYKNDWEGGDQDTFKYGFEYGEIYGLMLAFDINIEDLKK